MRPMRPMRRAGASHIGGRASGPGEMA
jgi:hypothetical protein